jgi:hypothetical protein
MRTSENSILPRSRVNKGKRKGRRAAALRPSLMVSGSSPLAGSLHPPLVCVPGIGNSAATVGATRGDIQRSLVNRNQLTYAVNPHT